MFSRNPRHVVIFSVIMMEGAPKCCLTEALWLPEERLYNRAISYTGAGINLVGRPKSSVLSSAIYSHFCRLSVTLCPDNRQCPFAPFGTEDRRIGSKQLHGETVRSDEFKSLLKK